MNVKNIKLNNGIDMPMLGLGVFRLKEQAEATYSVRTALESGYTHIDTAMIYENEEAVGKGIKESGVDRAKLFITTKVWNGDQRSDNVQPAFEDSLKRLGLDYIDLYLIHWPVKEKFVQTWLELEKIYQSGRVKAIGVSNFHEHHLDALAKVWSVVPAVNQIERHPYLTQLPLIEKCQKLGIVPEAWSPLGAAKNGLMELPLIVDLAKKYQKSPAQIILRWDIESGVVTIPKSSNAGRIKENLDIFDFQLSSDEVQAINALNKNERVGSDPDTFTF